MHAICAAGATVTTSAAASDSNAVSSPDASTSADAAATSAAFASTPGGVPDLSAEGRQGPALQAPQDAAAIAPDPSATAAGSLSVAEDQPVTSAEALSTAAADSATSKQTAGWAPSPPLFPAVRRTAPRPSALFRHSISAISHAAPLRHSKHHHAPACDGYHAPAHSQIDSTLQHQAVRASEIENDAEVWCSNSREGVLKRPATAGQVRSQTALHQVPEEQSSRPQTAAAAGRAWPPARYTVFDAQCHDSDTQALAS